MKKNKVNLESALKQFDALLPEDYREPYKKALTICKDSGAGTKDACEVAHKVLVCFYNNNPKFTFAWKNICNVVFCCRK